MLCILSSLPLFVRALPLPLDARLREEIIMVPSGEGGREQLETTVFRPPGPGPFPLLLMNHGKQPGPARVLIVDDHIDGLQMVAALLTAQEIGRAHV